MAVFNERRVDFAWAIQKLVDEKREFIRIGTEWFRVDANWMQEMRELMQQAEDESWTVRELLFRELPEDLSLPLEEEDADDALRDDPLFAFELQQSLKSYMEQLHEKKDCRLFHYLYHFKLSCALINRKALNGSFYARTGLRCLSSWRYGAR